MEEIVDEEIRRLELPPCEFGRQSAVLIAHHVALALRVEFERNLQNGVYTDAYVMARYHQLAGLSASKAASGQGDDATRPYDFHSNYFRGVFQNWMEELIGTPDPASIARLSVDGLTGSLIKHAKYLQRPLRVEVYSMPKKPVPRVSGTASGLSAATA